MSLFSLRHSLLGLVLLLIGSPLLAEDPARVSHVEGIASYEHRTEVDWTEVVTNLPVTAGDRFILQEDARVEVELHGGNFLRAGSNTDFRIATLESGQSRIELLKGDLSLRVNQDGDYSIRCGPWHATTEREGLYRLHCEPEEELWLAVRKGEAHLTSERGQGQVNAGEIVSVSNLQNGAFSSSHRYELDEFDLWNDRRDALYAGRLYSAESDEIRPGYYDLNLYGRWGNLSPYGRVWWPNVGHNWSPFRYGQWLRYPGWGWTWIGHEPWGWAPYHYGSWVYNRGFGRWCWVPRYNVWSPAIVNFYHGRGFIGWKPRGPRDPLHVDRSGIVTIGPRLVDPHPNGITIIPRENFITGRAHTDRFLVPGETLTRSLRPLQREQISERLARSGQSEELNLQGSQPNLTDSRAIPSRGARVIDIRPNRERASTATQGLATDRNTYTRPVPAFESPGVAPVQSFSNRSFGRRSLPEPDRRIAIPSQERRRDSSDIRRSTPTRSRQITPRSSRPRTVVPNRRIVVPSRQESMRPPSSRVEPARRPAPAPRRTAPSIQRSSPSSPSAAPGRGGRRVRDR